MMTQEKTGLTASSFTEQLLALTPSLFPLAEGLEEAAASDMPVLLTGATGTGKTHLARLLHQYSPRGRYPLVVAPCGALAESSVMAALFGQNQEGSEGVECVRAGRLETAGLGALLLKDIDALPLEAQAVLLRVLETGSYEPVGSKEIRTCQARIIAIANGDLKHEVIEKKFRGDLFYCFHENTFYLPPLCERRSDIEPLARAMVVRFANLFLKKPPRLLPETLRVLRFFPWPGNIRQLETCIQHAVLVCSGDELRVEHLPQALRVFPD